MFELARIDLTSSTSLYTSGHTDRGFANVPMPLKQTIAAVVYLWSHDDLNQYLLVLGEDIILVRRDQAATRIAVLLRYDVGIQTASGFTGCVIADNVLRIMSPRRPSSGNVEPATWCPGHLWLEFDHHLICLKHWKGFGMRKMFLDSKAP